MTTSNWRIHDLKTLLLVRQLLGSSELILDDLRVVWRAELEEVI